MGARVANLFFYSSTKIALSLPLYVPLFSTCRPRDEAASATVRGRNRTYAIGGMGERTVEFIDMSDFVMSAADGDDVTGMGEPAVFDARQVGFCTCALLTELNLL